MSTYDDDWREAFLRTLHGTASWAMEARGSKGVGPIDGLIERAAEIADAAAQRMQRQQKAKGGEPK
jgi:hypothetical protein